MIQHGISDRGIAASNSREQRHPPFRVACIYVDATRNQEFRDLDIAAADPVQQIASPLIDRMDISAVLDEKSHHLDFLRLKQDGITSRPKSGSDGRALFEERG